MNKYVEIFPWNDNFNTGITEIDDQHKKLVELLNKLASHLAYQSESPELSGVFNELAEYAAYHFKTEEVLWNRYFQDDAWLTSHKTTHAQFITDILKIKSQESKEPCDQVTEEIVAFLTNWLAFHILESDKRMAKAIFAIQQGSSLSEAKQQANAELDGAMRVLIEAILEMYRSLSTRTLQLIGEVNERQKAESKLRLADSAIESTMESIVIMDAEFNIIDTNPAFCSVANIRESDILGRKLNDLKPSLVDEHQSSVIWSALKESGHWGGEIWERNQEGELEPEWLTFSAIKNEQGKITNYVAIFSSISELIKRQQMLEGIANHDILTGLPNRRLLTDRLNQAVIHASRYRKLLAVCYLDLDGFKQVNDVFGHAAGDKLLQEIAQRFKSILRGDDTVARLGGDEFVLLFNDLSNPEDAFALLDRLLAVATEPVVFEKAQAFVSASIGVSFFPVDSSESNKLLQYADKAMYQAKRLGKSRYCIYQHG